MAPRPIEEAPWIGFGDNLGVAGGKRWTERNIGAAAPGLPGQFGAEHGRSRSPPAPARAFCPALSAISRADLARFGDPIGELDIDLWLLTHPDLRHSARVRAFTDFVGAELVKLRKTLEGA